MLPVRARALIEMQILDEFEAVHKERQGREGKLLPFGFDGLVTLLGRAAHCERDEGSVSLAVIDAALCRAAGMKPSLERILETQVTPNFLRLFGTLPRKNRAWRYRIARMWRRICWASHASACGR